MIQMEQEELRRRRALTFHEAEGLAALPCQLEPRQINQKMRTALFKVVHDAIVAGSAYVMNYGQRLGANWQAILADYNLEVLEKFADQFTDRPGDWLAYFRTLFEHGTYADVLDTLQFVLRHPNRPYHFADQVSHALIVSRSAYRVFEETTIAPIASDAEAEAVQGALRELRHSEMAGARVHLLHAGEALSEGRWADSVRESIHAVESVVRQLGKSSSVEEALKRLATKGHINTNMRAGFGRLYNYTSDEKGIRHPLLDDGDAKVDEADALYMFGASAAFVSYLLAKGRATGFLGK